MLLSESLKNVPKLNLHNFRIINAYLEGSRFGHATQKHINLQQNYYRKCITTCKKFSERKFCKDKP